MPASTRSVAPTAAAASTRAFTPFAPHSTTPASTGPTCSSATAARRRRALRATEDALNKQKEQLLTLDNEIVGFREAIREAQTKNHKLSSVLSRTEGEVTNLEKQIDSLLANKSKSNEKFVQRQKALQDEEAKRKQHEDEARILDAKIDAVKKKSQRIATDIVEVEDRVSRTLSQHSMLKKGSEAALAEAEIMKNKIREKEMHVEQMENELARIRTLMLEPQVLLLDEPSMGLAPRLVEEVFAIIARLKEQRVTMLLVEQFAAAALEVADFGYVMENGRLSTSGPADKLRNDPAVKAAYLGTAH